MALTLSIDLGTSNLKVGLVNDQGEVLASASSVAPKQINKYSIEEQNPDALKDLIIVLCKQVLEGKDKNEVAYLITASYQFGLMLLDENRKPLTGMTLLTDTRSQRTFSDFLSFYENENIYKRTGCPLISQYVLPRLYFFYKEDRELFEKAKYFSDSKSFLFDWLTGEWITDMSTAAATQLYNLNDFQWDRGILSKMDLSGNQFPGVKDGTKYMTSLKEKVCKTLGLQDNVKAILGVYDGAALGIGLSGLRDKVGIVNIGTSAMIRVPGKRAVFDKNPNKRIQAYPIRKGLFLNGGALNNATLPLDWMKNKLFDFNVQNLAKPKSNQSPPLMSLPYLTGERDSLTGPYASGVFLGIRETHGKADFVQSILEGVAFSMRYIYEAFKENDIEIKEIRMGGGGSRIKVWPQIFADILELPISITQEKEMALVGNAMLAFTVGHLFKNLEEASIKMLRESKKVNPDCDQIEIRNKQFLFYEWFRDSLSPLYHEHMELRKI